jgi:SPASM domain peptide maturase of grasp-with-spasm system
MENKQATKVLAIFSDCIVTSGPIRGVINDLTRRNFQFVPLNLIEMLNECQGFTKEKIIEYYGADNTSTIDEYINFLEENEFIFWRDVFDLEYFPVINLEWKCPSLISNVVIDYDRNSTYQISAVLRDIKSLNCQNIQIRSFDYKSLEFWSESLECLNDSQVKSVELITKWSPVIENTTNFIENNPRLNSIMFHSSPQFEIFDQDNNPMGNIVFISEKINNSSHCGQIHWNYFNVNIKLFTEAQKHNTCLNRKISIDVNGDIKNCPSMAKSYGNIKDTTLAEAIEKPGFKDMWFINKDQIDVCKDCEFRYICTDCRAYIENPEDIYSKPLKCGYNPYTAEWEEWSTNPLKQKAIEYYGMQELVKKEK